MESNDENIKNWINELAVKDSQEALRKLFILFYPQLHSFACYYVHSGEIAEELVSDVFLSVWNKRKQLLEIQNFRSYLYVIARNLAISHLRKEPTLKVEVKDSYLETLHRSHNNPETELISAETMERLNHAIESLPDKCRQIYRLVREHDLKYKEVSDILNISIKTIESHMSLAIKRLREVLSDELKK